jgi:hypothetical protein
LGAGEGQLSSPSDSIDSAPGPPQEEAPSPSPSPASSSYTLTEVPLGDPFVPLSGDLAGTPQHELASQFTNTTPPADDLHYLCERKDSGDGRDADKDDRDDVIMLSDGSVLRESYRKRGGDEADASNSFVGGSILRLSY